MTQFTSGTHYYERQRFKSIYTSLENPKHTSYVRQLSPHMATFHKYIEQFGPGPTSPNGQSPDGNFAGIKPAHSKVLGTVQRCSCKCYISLLVPIYQHALGTLNTCSSSDHTGWALTNTGRATVAKTHVLLQPTTCSSLSGLNLINTVNQWPTASKYRANNNYTQQVFLPSNLYRYIINSIGYLRQQCRWSFNQCLQLNTNKHLNMLPV